MLQWGRVVSIESFQSRKSGNFLPAGYQHPVFQPWKPQLFWHRHAWPFSCWGKSRRKPLKLQYFPSKLHSMTSHMTPPHLVISPQAPLGPPMPCSSSPAATAEAPELSYGEVWIITMYELTVQWWLSPLTFKTKITMVIQAADIPPGVSLQRRNSAPEMSEPAQFVDHGSMELW